MLKKLQTKRGFTLVEVLVAFVIFAIMAGMVGVILNSTMRAKQENVKVEEQIEEQKQAYFQKEQPISQSDYSANKDAGNTTGSVSMDFYSGTSKIGSATVDYVAADPTGTQDELELQYYIGEYGNDAWKTPKTTTPDPNGNGGGSVTSGLDCGIYGSNGIESIEIGIEERTVDGKLRYYIFMHPVAVSMSSRYINYTQVRVKFPSDVVKYGYCNASGGDASDKWSSYVDLMVPGDTQTLRIAGNGNDKSIFYASDQYPCCWVELESPLTSEQLADPVKIFGNSGSTPVTTRQVENANPESDAIVTLANFSRYTVEDDPSTKADESKTYVNVFAATADPTANPGGAEE